jgi:hypothetical protein
MRGIAASHTQSRRPHWEIKANGGAPRTPLYYGCSDNDRYNAYEVHVPVSSENIRTSQSLHAVTTNGWPW